MGLGVRDRGFGVGKGAERCHGLHDTLHNFVMHACRGPPTYLLSYFPSYFLTTFLLTCAASGAARDPPDSWQAVASSKPEAPASRGARTWSGLRGRGKGQGYGYGYG